MKIFTMMLAKLAWFLIGLFLLSVNGVHAEGVCPPGMFPTNPPGTQGPVSCAPIPGYDDNQQQAQPQQLPPPKWVNHWGAIATSLPQGIVGVSTNFNDEPEATQAALSDCRSKGGADCKIKASYGNRCIALIVGNPGYNTTPGATVNIAIAAGLKTCNDAGDTNCHAIYSACSLPERIQ